MYQDLNQNQKSNFINDPLEKTSQTLHNFSIQNNNSNQSTKNQPSLLRYRFFSDSPKSSHDPENMKNLLLQRFKKNKKQLLQTSSIYIETGRIKKKRAQSFNQPNILAIIKQTSLQKLPRIVNPSIKLFNSPLNHRKLSKTIDHSQSLSGKLNGQIKNKSIYSSFDLGNDKSQIFNVQKDGSADLLSKAKMHLMKKKSLDLSIEQTKFSKTIANDPAFRDNHKLSNLGFDEETKKKYIKHIVDRYFSIPQPQQQQKQSFSPHKSPKSYKKSISNQKLPSLNQNKRVESISPIKSKKQKQNNQQDHQQEEQQLTNLVVPPKSYHLEKQTLNFQQSNSFEPFHLIKSTSSALSLSQSYVLQKIQEEQADQHLDHPYQDFYNSSSSLNLSSSLLHNKSSESIMNSSSQQLIDVFNRSQSKDSLQDDYNHQAVKQKRQKIYENGSFIIEKIKRTAYKQLSEKKDIRKLNVQYEIRKQFKSLPALQLRRRQLLAKNIIQTKSNPANLLISAVSLWHQDQFDHNCLILNLSKISPPCPARSSLPLTLSKLLYELVPVTLTPTTRQFIIKPFSEVKLSLFLTQQSLLQNHHFNLIKLIQSITTQLLSLEHSLINNKISLSNILLLDQNRYVINEWSYSYIKYDNIIQEKKFQKRLEPIMKNQQQQWFVTPQYLAPEILQNLLYSQGDDVKYWKKIKGRKMYLTSVKEHDLFEHGNKSDVWSLGLMILEIITLIPMWIGQKCVVQGRRNPKISPRRGFLFAQHRDLSKILTKQSYLTQNILKIIKLESQPYEIQTWLIDLLQRMLDLNPETRISLSKISKILQSKEKEIKQVLKRQ